MLRKLMAAAVVGVLCGAAAVADDAPKPGGKGPGGPGGKFGFDKGKLLEKLDANGDGKLSKVELGAFQEKMAEKFKEKTGKEPPAGLAGKMFEKADANGDGVLTKEEFEKAGPPGGKGGFPGKGGKGPPRGEKQ